MCLLSGSVETMFEMVPKLHKLSHLWNNTNILTGNKLFTSPLWASKEICMLGNIYSEDGSYSFHNLPTLFDILLFFFIWDWVPRSTSLPSHPIAGWFDLVSQMYSSLLKTVKTFVNWGSMRKGFRTGWTSSWLAYSMVKNNLTSQNRSHQFIHYTIIHRMYATPYRRYRMGLKSDPNCTVCQKSVISTMYHMIWECSVINHCWTQVCWDLEKKNWLTDWTLVQWTNYSFF